MKSYLSILGLLISSLAYSQHADSTLVHDYVFNDDGNYDRQREYVLYTDSGFVEFFEAIQPGDTTYSLYFTEPYDLRHSLPIEAMGSDSVINVEHWNNGWEPYSRTILQYNAGNLLTDSIIQVYHSSWEDSLKYEFIYNASGKLTSFIHQSWNGASWNNIAKTEHYYDAGDLDTLEIHYNGSGVIWVPSNQTQRGYGFLPPVKILEIYSTFNGVGFDYSSKHEFDYANSNTEVNDTSYGWNGSTWDYQSLIFSHYNTFGFADSVHEANWDGSTFEPYRYSIISQTDPYYSYVERYIYTGGSYFIYQSISYTYDQAGRLIASTFNGHAGSSGGSEEYIYDNDGFLLYAHTFYSTMGGIITEYTNNYSKVLHSRLFESTLNLCDTSSFNPSVRYYGGRGNNQYLWSGAGNIQLPTDSSPSILPNQSGYYFIAIADSNGNVFTDSLLINLQSITPIDLGADSTVCRQDLTTILAPSGYDTYTWSNGGTTMEDTMSLPLQFVQDTSIVFYCTATQGLCSTTDSIQVQFLLCFGVSENDLSNSLDIISNPVNEFLSFNIFSGKPEKAKLKIYNVTGNLISEKNILLSQGTQKYTENVNSLSFGIYILEINSSMRRLIARFVKSGQ